MINELESLMDLKPRVGHCSDIYALVPGEHGAPPKLSHGHNEDCKFCSFQAPAYHPRSPVLYLNASVPVSLNMLNNTGPGPISKFWYWVRISAMGK